MKLTVLDPRGVAVSSATSLPIAIHDYPLTALNLRTPDAPSRSFFGEHTQLPPPKSLISFRGAAALGLSRNDLDSDASPSCHRFRNLPIRQDSARKALRRERRHAIGNGAYFSRRLIFRELFRRSDGRRAADGDAPTRGAKETLTPGGLVFLRRRHARARVSASRFPPIAARRST